MKRTTVVLKGSRVTSSKQTRTAYAIHNGKGDFYREQGVPFLLFTSKKEAAYEVTELRRLFPGHFFEVKKVFVDVSF